MRVHPMLMCVVVAVMRGLGAKCKCALQPVGHRLIGVGGGGHDDLDATLRQTVLQAAPGTPGDQQRNAIQRVWGGAVCMGDFVQDLLFFQFDFGANGN